MFIWKFCTVKSNKNNHNSARKLKWKCKHNVNNLQSMILRKDMWDSKKMYELFLIIIHLKNSENIWYEEWGIRLKF